MTKCNNTNCTKEAILDVCISLAVHDKHPPAVSTPLFQVCAEHSDIKWEDAVPEVSWNKIYKGMKDQGYQIPKKEFSKLIFLPIDNKRRNIPNPN